MMARFFGATAAAALALILWVAVAVLGIAAGTAAAAPPTTGTDARVVVYNLIENNRETCPMVHWKFSKVQQAAFPGIAHPGRGKLLWKVTAQIEWAGVSMFLHNVSWTVVGKQALPADMDRSSRIYRDREAAWIMDACMGDPPFGQG